MPQPRTLFRGQRAEDHAGVRYDVKLEDEGKRPNNEWLGYACLPSQRAQVLFRKQQAV